MAPSYLSWLSKWPLPSTTTQCCFSNLLNEFYYTPKKSKIHIKIATTQCCFGMLLNKFYYTPNKSKIHLSIATTQFCFGKLLNEFYYTSKKLEIHLNIGLKGRGDIFLINFFEQIMQKTVDWVNRFTFSFWPIVSCFFVIFIFCVVIVQNVSWSLLLLKYICWWCFIEKIEYLETCLEEFKFCVVLTYQTFFKRRKT